jgi:hypothetical protein
MYEAVNNRHGKTKTVNANLALAAYSSLHTAHRSRSQ